MTFWNLYFILKLYLYATGHLTPLWLANIVFAAALALGSLARGRGWRMLHLVAGLAIGLPLMYREAHVPPFARLAEELSALTTFSLGYWIELLQRFVPPLFVVASAGFVIAYLILNRVVRVATLVLIALIALPVWQAGHEMLVHANVAAGPRVAQGAAAPGTGAGTGTAQRANPDTILTAFRAEEAQRHVRFTHLGADANAQFDVVILHICSLSWDDLDVAKARNHPLLKHFDFLFTNFSTAASYSGPAAIRVLRADCGQQAH
ncbi:MAG: cellulose biosynthesis protein BcsG, partial [Burkholderiales bacterium]